MSSFIHLHVHSSYSVLDGMSSVSGLVDRAVKCGMNAVALTDHGNMFGIKEFYNYAKKKNGKLKDEIKNLKKQLESTAAPEEEKEKIRLQIEEKEKKIFKPIIGSEVYVARRGRNFKDKDAKEDRSGYHLILLAKNLEGYKNLSRLVSIGWTEGFYYRPRIDHELLEKYSEGLIASSACLGGEIHKYIEKGDLSEAEKRVLWYKKVFGDDYYLELQRHKTDKEGADTETYEKQMRQNEDLIKLARKTNTKLIATNDVHFLEEEHADAHEHLICLSTGKDLDDPTRMRYTKQEWLKSPEEMAEIFADIPEALENTLEIADKIENYSIDSAPMMPVFPIPEDFGTEEEYKKKFSEEDLKTEFDDAYERLGGYEKVIRVKLEADYLTKLTYEGAEKRYGSNLNDETRERIDFELNVMKKMGFPGYFLIVQDFIQAARDMGISVGPGRGSAAGSVVAYCLKITNIDPLPYDLLFERFLNPDRISMPDIDIDFEDDKRGQVMRWVTDKYGKERVANIVTYGSMATKSSIKDVARVQKLPLSEAERLTKLIPQRFPKDENGNDIKINISNCIKHVPELREARNSNNPMLSNTLRFAEMLEGTVRQTGVHACGLIIGSDDLRNLVPLSTAVDKETKEDKVITQYEGSVIEEIGLIKMDFLGLKTLSIIKDAVANIKKSKGIDIDIDNIPLDDKKTYKLFSKGDTVGVFQFESAGMQKYLKDLKPTKFEDLIAMNALYRPGPMDYIPQFVRRKHGEEPIEYPFPVMEKRLKETYGITVYQEQVMLLSRDLAGFTRGQSDELRKAMGKKLKDKMESLHEKFIEGAQKNGFGPVEKLEQIWDDWAKFASYAFNKSHATCYSLVAYQTAYIKAHYPAEFMAANLTRNKDDISEVGKLMDECKSMGINVMGPDINESELTFTVNKDGHIRFGLGGIKNVGDGAVESIISERENNGKFKNVFDFFERVNLTSCNKKNVESLVLAGAFDTLPDIKREQFFTNNSKEEQVLETLLRYGNLYQQDAAFNQNSLFGSLDNSVDIAKPEIPYANEWTGLVKLNKEREMIGMYLSAHPMDEFEFEMNNICNASTADLKDLTGYQLGTGLKIGGMMTSFRRDTAKNGKPYGRFTLEDYSGAHEFFLFGDNYESFGKYLIDDLFVFIHGIVQVRGSDFKNYKPDPNVKPELEMKIVKMMPIKDIRKAVKRIKISLSLQKLDNDVVMELTDAILENKGDVNVYVEVKDFFSSEKVTLFARHHSIKINSAMYQYLKRAKEEEILDYKVEMS
ncbi:DNA polymerase III, alpha subunit [uncultured Paludibacter sp.]|uniref:DNA polymerase III subunit alpha n=1 Tax=uncultured Paludibacter sp. TaxID=497635 RepID=A0A653AHW8_9BACT|nr:DNA polymerase III, alpha subunit [uncultured Paludibacter sp.]